MEKYILKKSEIDEMPGVAKQHFLNPDARRTNKSLGDLTGLTGFGFHIIDVPPGKESTEYHVHFYEDECTYVLSGVGKVIIGDQAFDIAKGDFIGYRAGGEPHTMINTGSDVLQCIVVGQRLPHDVGDYPRKNKRIYRNDGQLWEIVDHNQINRVDAGRK